MLGVSLRTFLVCTALLLVTLNAKAISAFGVMSRPAFQTFHCKSRLHVAMRDASVAMNETSVNDAHCTKEGKDMLPFDPAIWQVYESTVRTVMEKRRILKRKDKPEDVSSAVGYLLDNRSFLPAPTPDSRVSMNQQKLKFLVGTNLTETQHELAMRVLTYLGDHCAKVRTPSPLIVAWRKLKEAGMVPRENCISTYLYALSLDNETSATTAEVATFHDLFYEPNEKTITLRIKSMISNNDAAGAEELLGSSPVGIALRQLS